MKKIWMIFSALLVIPAVLFADDGGGEKQDMMKTMMFFALQLGVIIVVARTVGLIIRKLNLGVPSVLVELLIGIAIGPYLLGGVALPGFPDGIFPVSHATSLPISPELYGIATVASIIMLFSAGLETDLSLMMKSLGKGFLIGFGGVFVSFVLGASITLLAGPMLIGHPLHFSDPLVLFMAMIGVSTSLGIMARILSDEHKMGTPESVTALAASVVDDVLGLMVLTIVTSIIAMSAAGGGADAGGPSAAVVIIKAVAVLLVFGIAGIVFAGPLAKLIKSFKTIANISIFALGLALIMAGVFQMAGLALIIGAYVVGLSLSKTDLSETVRDALAITHDLLVPFFFIVMGMLVDVRAIMDKDVLLFGGAYALCMVAGKMIGCGFPTLFMNFNLLGTLRVGTVMVPRGEVAIIMSGIGLAAGFLDKRFFGVAILMVFINNLLSPPVITKLYRMARKGTKKDVAVRQSVSTPIETTSHKLGQLLEQRVVQEFRSEAFFVNSIALGPWHNVYHLRKNDINITLDASGDKLLFNSDARDVNLIKTIASEALVEIHDLIESVKDLITPSGELKDQTGTAHEIGGGAADAEAAHARKMDAGEIKHALTPGSVITNLTGSTKREIVEQLVGLLQSEGFVKDAKSAVDAVMERDASKSTGMQNGVAIPHARTDVVDEITVAIGLSQNGVDFQSIDGEPSKIFVLILSPLSTESPLIQFLASVSALLDKPESRAKLLDSKTREEIYTFFKDGMKH